jgi:hypothetical protein
MLTALPQVIPAPGIPITRWNYSVPIPLHNILEVLELVVPDLMIEFADRNILMMNSNEFHNVRLPSYASVLDALMQ